MMGPFAERITCPTLPGSMLRCPHIASGSEKWQGNRCVAIFIIVVVSTKEEMKHLGCNCRSRYHTLLAASGSVGGTDDHNFRRHLSKKEHVEDRAPTPKGQSDVEVSDEVAEETRYGTLVPGLVRFNNQGQHVIVGRERCVIGDCLLE